VPLDSEVARVSPQGQLVHKRFMTLLDRAGRAGDAACLFVGTRSPSLLGLELNLKFNPRVPVLPITSPATALSLLGRQARQRRLALGGPPPPPPGSCRLTALHFESVLEEVQRRADGGLPLDGTVWDVLPPGDDLDELIQEATRWANTPLARSPE